MDKNIKPQHLNNDVVSKTKDGEAREFWSGRFDFVVSCLGYAVGLSNIWRFPYLCYKNGGGAFLIPYCTLLMFACIPLFFLEFTIGQYSSSSMIKMWRAVPIMRGLSFCQIISIMVTTGYYNVVICYALYYCFASFTPNLPWVGCHHPWNTLECSELLDDCLGNNGIILSNGSCVPVNALSKGDMDFYNISMYNDTTFDIGNYTDPFKEQRRLPSEEYWTNQLLQESSSITEVGSVVWQLALCNLFVWVVIFFIIVKGIKTSGKVVYFTALFPYVMLTALLIRAVTLDGHYDGILYYITPDLKKLAHPQPWKDAAQQVFFSSSAGVGSLPTLASFNRFHNNYLNDVVIVAVGNSLTSFYCGFVVFAILGYMAKKVGSSVKDVVRSGFGLVFIVCPEGLARFPGAPAWSALFFFMLFLLALDSQFVCTEALITVVIDEFPWLRKRRVYVVVAFCVSMYITGLTYVTNAGAYWLALMDNYASGWISMVSGITVPLSFCWIYGFDRLKNDIRCMLGSKIVDHWTFYFWKMTWSFATPGIIVAILLYNMIKWDPPRYNGPFPAWAHVIGWLFIVSTLIFIPVIWIYDMVRTTGTFIERLRFLTKPDVTWGPALLENRMEAYLIHQRHGTTLGGYCDPKDVLLSDDDAVLHVKMIPLKTENGPTED